MRLMESPHLGNVRVVSNDITSRAVSTVAFTTKICNFAMDEFGIFQWKYPSMSEYSYVTITSIIAIDPDGRDGIVWNDFKQKHFRSLS